MSLPICPPICPLCEKVDKVEFEYQCSECGAKHYSCSRCKALFTDKMRDKK